MRIGSNGFRRGLLPAALLLLTGTLAAQSTADRKQLAAFEDSLSRITTRDALLQLSGKIDGQRGAMRSEVKTLRRGLLELRRVALNDTVHLIPARQLFESVARSQPDWSWGWYGLARIAERNPSLTPLLAQGLFALLQAQPDAASHREHLADWLRTLPSVQLPVSPRDDATRQSRALQDAAQHSAEESLLLAAGIALYRSHQPATAVALFREAARQETGNAMAHLMLARAMAVEAVPVDTSAFGPLQTEYFAGAGVPGAEASYQADLVNVASEREAEVFAKLATAARPAFLATFWNRRDDSAGTTPGTALATTLSRLQEARENLAIRSFPEADPLDAPIDDRGRLYVLLGNPVSRRVFRDSLNVGIGPKHLGPTTPVDPLSDRSSPESQSRSSSSSDPRTDPFGYPIPIKPINTRPGVSPSYAAPSAPVEEWTYPGKTYRFAASGGGYRLITSSATASASRRAPP